jgi:hypothetical protein
MEKQIKWEKWVDPFLSNLDDFNLPDDNEDDDDDSFGKYESTMQNKPFKKIGMGPVMMGPMGMIPLTENNIPSKIYCFWMGHTNFNITPEIAREIELVEGVECLDIFTRYRFRVAVGKAFLNSNLDEHGREIDPFGMSVLKSISDKVCPKIKQGKCVVSNKTAPILTNDNGINLLKRSLKKKFAFWVICVLPDGQLDPIGAETKEEVLKIVEEKHCNTIVTSWE